MVRYNSSIQKEILDNGKIREQIIAHIQVSPETKTGRRLVICPAGIYLKRIRGMYRDKLGRAPSQNDFVFQNIGTSHSRADHFVGQPLTDNFFRKLWYELIKDLSTTKVLLLIKHIRFIRVGHSLLISD